MDELTKVGSGQRSPDVSRTQQHPACLDAINSSPSTGKDLLTIPKRKLSVFYRSFDVVAQIDQNEEKGPLRFRRTSSSPSVRIERAEEDTDSRNRQAAEQFSLQNSGFVNNCCSLIESGRFFGDSSPDRPGKLTSSSTNSHVSKASSLSLIESKLPLVREDATIDNYSTITETSIGQHYRLNKKQNYVIKTSDGDVATKSGHDRPSSDPTRNSVSTADKKLENPGMGDSANATIDLRGGNSTRAGPIHAGAVPCTDLVRIKDPEYPRSDMNPTSAGRLGKYTSVDAEMSSHEDTPNRSDSEDGSIKQKVQAARNARDKLEKIEKRRSKSNSPSFQPTLTFSVDRSWGESLASGEDKLVKTEEFVGACWKRGNRQRCFVERRSLSEGDCERYHRAKRRSRCTKEEDYINEKEHCQAFPSFTDRKLKNMGLFKVEDINNLYRENIPEDDLERKYIAFSMGLGIDRITLHRRMALSIRQRDQSERNFKNEIQKMQGDIQELCSLCTDQESIDKVAKVRERLDMIERSVHGISCAAETLGAVHQEQRISKAIYMGDKYLQVLRSRCENLTAEILETKQILWKNNIVIEETSGIMGDDLTKIRYKNGLPGNNRTVVARRRASIATISRPLNSQDVIKESPRCCSQRNSLSGRITLRRPSLCSDVQRWENEKLNRTDTSSVVELRGIVEHGELQMNSIEENNNLLRIEERNSVCTGNTPNASVTSETDDKGRLITKQNSLLDSNLTKTAANQIKSCIRTAEPLRITGNIENWRPVLWYILIFFLGFFAKQITSAMNKCDESL